jgi:glycosyltransferase involved in cell wall biosynthesis
MRVLYISYPLLTVSGESAGGAEQMLWTLEREMAAREVKTTVAASDGSDVAGELFATGAACDEPDDFERRNLEHQDRIIAFVHQRSQGGTPFDVVHDKSGSFWPRAAEVQAPVLATLHLPRHFYPEHYFERIPENVSFNCVSQSQAQSFSDLPRMLGVVRNGILLECFTPNYGERHGLVWLGRICEEKGTHVALDIAAKAGMPITIAGQVYPLSYHQQYFDREIAPRVQGTSNARLVASPSFEHKRRLLCEAQAVLITSLVDETSSVVAMEAAASGTPVIAFHRGALPEVIEDRVTGFLVQDTNEAVSALQQIHQISAQRCASHAHKNFSSKSMADGYAALYRRLLNS